MLPPIVAFREPEGKLRVFNSIHLLNTFLGLCFYQKHRPFVFSYLFTLQALEAGQGEGKLKELARPSAIAYILPIPVCT